MGDRSKGLTSNFRVEKLNDSDGKHSNCRYFVLDLDHDKHAIPAILAYAISARADGYELLADDLEAAVTPDKK